VKSAEVKLELHSGDWGDMDLKPALEGQQKALVLALKALVSVLA
jgi:hypothetical protein